MQVHMKVFMAGDFNVQETEKCILQTSYMICVLRTRKIQLAQSCFSPIFLEAFKIQPQSLRTFGLPEDDCNRSEE